MKSAYEQARGSRLLRQQTRAYGQRAETDFIAMGAKIQMSDQAIILFAHGARDPEWAAPFDIIKQQLQAARPEVQVELAFLEFMTPSLEAAVALSAAQGAKRIVLVPLFMAQGGHLKQDLPLLVEKIRQRYPQLEVQVMPAIGDAPEILQAITDWVLRSASA
jgi:sirohydrochlorin cobaltochelatase